jgi:hypothetical protein
MIDMSSLIDRSHLASLLQPASMVVGGLVVGRSY